MTEKTFTPNYNGEYVTRDGRMAKVVGYNPIDIYTPVAAIVDLGNGVFDSILLTQGGRYHFNEAESEYDIFDGKLYDKPHASWEHLAEHIVAIARNRNGDVWAFTVEPVIATGGSAWGANGGSKFNISCLNTTKAGTCDWKESLVLRPTKGE